ncbi:MAG: transporter substrate-binding domain-containing protein [Lautropia sp.]|nr:transporter substrate-binding domain-containing protein [Lautropia sp.]
MNQASIDSALIDALAPSGKLRAVINLGNPLLARRGPDGGDPVGVSVDLAHALARLLGLELVLDPVDVASAAVAAVTEERADIGFFAIDPQRAAGIGFTAPYVLIEGAYLVRDASPLKDNGEVDASGHRIVVGKGSAYDLYLSRNIQHATLVRTTSSQAVVDTFMAGGHEVAAGVRQQLQHDAARVPGLRLLPGHFMVIQQAMGLPKGRGAGAHALLSSFVEQIKANGEVEAALRRHHADGASVAPAATV